MARSLKKWCLIAVLIFAAQLMCQAADALELTGTVLGKAAQVKSFVRVEIGGPTQATLFTNDQGKFSVEVEAGEYVIVVRERMYSKTFRIYLDRNFETTFYLDW